jgi:NAD(P)-dependent dehydrogenase (short-subunit alcohol dehydrogenase family)
VRLALVTGGNRGIGLATARRLARERGHVVLTSRDAVAGAEGADRLVREGLEVSSLVVDVTDAGSIRSAARRVGERFGHLDVLVNNAGILPEATNGSPAEAVDLAMFERTFATNLLGPVAVLEAFLPLLRKSPAGRIVNVSSTMGCLSDQTDPQSPYYATVVPAYQSSKAALNSVTIALSKMLAGTSIKVTSVCPGFVRTGLTPGSREQATLDPEAAAEVVYRAATLPANASSGTFIDAAGTVAW